MRGKPGIYAVHFCYEYLESFFPKQLCEADETIFSLVFLQQNTVKTLVSLKFKNRK